MHAHAGGHHRHQQPSAGLDGRHVCTRASPIRHRGVVLNFYVQVCLSREKFHTQRLPYRDRLPEYQADHFAEFHPGTYMLWALVGIVLAIYNLPFHAGRAGAVFLHAACGALLRLAHQRRAVHPHAECVLSPVPLSSWDDTSLALVLDSLLMHHALVQRRACEQNCTHVHLKHACVCAASSCAAGACMWHGGCPGKALFARNDDLSLNKGSHGQDCGAAQ